MMKTPLGSFFLLWLVGAIIWISAIAVLIYFIFWCLRHFEVI